MNREAEFTIEKVVIGVPTRFVVLGGVQIQEDEFRKDLEALWELGAKAKEADRLNYEWIDFWEERGVLKRYDITRGDFYGDLTWHMVGPGEQYQPFMESAKKFEAERSAEMAKTAKERKRGRLQAQLKALDEPERALTLGEIMDEIMEEDMTVG